MIDVGGVAGLAAYLTNCQVGAATPTRAQLLVPCLHDWQGQVMIRFASNASVNFVATIARFPQFLNVRRASAQVTTSEEILARLTWLVLDAFGAMRGEQVKMAPPAWRHSAEKLVLAVALLCGGAILLHAGRPKQWHMRMPSGETKTIVFNLDRVCVHCSRNATGSEFVLPALTTMHPRHSILVSGCHCEAEIIKWLCVTLRQQKTVQC